MGFANFYKQFIQEFSKLAALFISMLKTTSTEARNENLEQISKQIQMENQGKKEPIQKSCKYQKIPKSKKWI